MPPVNFITLHNDLVAINSVLTEVRDALVAIDLSSLMTMIENQINLDNVKFEWLHDQDPTEIVLEP